MSEMYDVILTAKTTDDEHELICNAFNDNTAVEEFVVKRQGNETNIINEDTCTDLDEVDKLVCNTLRNNNMNIVFAYIAYGPDPEFSTYGTISRNGFKNFNLVAHLKNVAEEEATKLEQEEDRNLEMR